MAGVRSIRLGYSLHPRHLKEVLDRRAEQDIKQGDASKLGIDILSSARASRILFFSFVIIGLDYFIFPCGLFRDIPPFAVGRPAWDNWLVYKARSLGLPVIDATKMVTAIHQNHAYSHHPMGKEGA